MPDAPPPPKEYVPVWPVVERTQKQVAPQYWLVSQPDHAALSGALAANFVSPDFPAVDPLIARAIEVHDSGWAIFDSETSPTVPPGVTAQGKPVSFLEIDPPDFLRAWTASIDRAESLCPDGGYIVSRHFSVLGEGRLRSDIDTDENSARLRSFLQHEAGRQHRLQATAARGHADLERLLLVLQFCDVLSLYLCAGLRHAVEFPHLFEAGKVRMRREDDAFILEPSPFRSGREGDTMASLGVEARLYPSAAPKTTVLAFLLW